MRKYVDLLCEIVRTDIAQRREEGADMTALQAECDALFAGDFRISELLSLHQRILSAPIVSLSYDEPSDWQAIVAACADGPTHLAVSLSEDTLYDRILGGWLGRCAGCLLGKPLESIRTSDADPHPGHRRYIRSLLESVGAYPLRGYVPYIPAERQSFILHKSWRQAVAGHIQGMPRDDDIDYALLNLQILEQYGPNWTPEQALSEWIRSLPYGRIYGAGRAAYRNFGVGGIPAERAAVVGNAYRQSLGGMIRAAVWGWTQPGRLRVAAELAYRDGAMSQTQNGIYAGVFWAAAIAAAFALDDPVDILTGALKQIPARSRLAESVHLVLDQYQGGMDWEQATGAIYERYGDLPGNHSLPNAAIAAMGLLYGGGDFSLSIERTVMAGFDTDCTGATVGSVMGVVLGAQRLPAVWTEPLQDQVTTSLALVGRVSISELARRTWNLARGLPMASVRDR